MNEKRLCEFLVGIYEHLKAQADSLYHSQCGATALVQALIETHPEISQAYEKHYREFEKETSDRHAATLASIDALIDILKSGKL